MNIKKNIDFFLDNPSGWKTVEKKLKNYDNELVNKILEFTNTNELRDLPFKTKVWHFLYRKLEIPKCGNCQNPIKFGRSLNEGYNKFCSLSCTNKSKDHITQVSNTINKKYGGMGTKSEIIKNKIKDSTKKKFGVDNIFEDSGFIKNKFKEKYGVENCSQVPEFLNKINTTNIEKYGVIRSFLSEKSRKKNYKTKENKFLVNYPNFKFLESTGKDLKVFCEKCQNDYIINRTTFKFRVNNNHETCLICHPLNDKTSFIEEDLINFIKNIYNKEILLNDRNIIHPKEIDIYLPENKIGFEIHGLYWHSEIYCENNYHKNKFLLSELKNIRLIQIFEDEWKNKRPIVESIIKSNLNIYENKIFARKCLIKELKSKIYNDFCENNHIQGKSNAKIKLGLYYDNELVSVMSFGGLRISNGYKSHNHDEYELIRFCNKLNTIVIGGATKLFNYFFKKYNPIKIISYSDNRYFDGKLYKILGFELDSITRPNYFYSKDFKIREHRFKYRKDILVSKGENKTLTEHQIMNNNKYYQIYDAGNKKWALTF